MTDRWKPVSSGGVTVRHANPEDIDWLVGQLKNFSEFAGTKRRLFEDPIYAQTGIAQMIDNHLVLVSQEPGKLTGFIAGYIGPHPYNPSIEVLTEAFWWVDPDSRGTRAGGLLLSCFIEYGKDHADWIIMSLERNSPVKDESLLKRGFVLQEKSFLLET